MTDRETIYLDDTPIFVYEARRPNMERPDDFDGVPAQPTDVWFKVYSGTEGELLEIDDSPLVPLGLEGSYLYMSAMNEVEDQGAFIYVRVPSEVSEATGSYTLYITCVYDDNMKITHAQRVQVAEYR